MAPSSPYINDADGRPVDLRYIPSTTSGFEGSPHAENGENTASHNFVQTTTQIEPVTSSNSRTPTIALPDPEADDMGESHPHSHPGNIETGNGPGKRSLRARRVAEFLCEEVDTHAATPPLWAFSFMSGYINAISFTACYIWCGFQTGNTVQLALSLARTFSGPPELRMPGLTISDKQALTSLLSFMFGALLSRTGDYSLAVPSFLRPGAGSGSSSSLTQHQSQACSASGADGNTTGNDGSRGATADLGPPKNYAKTRRWLILGTLIQALLTLAAALCALYAHQSGIAVYNYSSSAAQNQNQNQGPSAGGTPASWGRAGISWTDPLGFCALAFLSVSMGLQGVMATRLGSPLGNTVVLTSVWVNLMADRTLFHLPLPFLSPSRSRLRRSTPAQRKSRNIMALSILCVFLGGLTGRALANTVHPSLALGTAAGLRVAIAVSWGFVKGKERTRPGKEGEA